MYIFVNGGFIALIFQEKRQFRRFTNLVFPFLQTLLHVLQNKATRMPSRPQGLMGTGLVCRESKMAQQKIVSFGQKMVTRVPALATKYGFQVTGRAMKSSFTVTSSYLFALLLGSDINLSYRQQK